MTTSSYINFLPRISLIKAISVFCILISSAIAAVLLTPNFHSIAVVPDFEKIIPKEFGDWKVVLNPYAQVSLTTNNNDQLNLLYDQVLMRTYVNSKGEQVMLALAYANEQKQDVKIHRPEVCYVAQGFSLVSQQDTVLKAENSSSSILSRRLLTKNQSRYEAVSYWIRVGDEYPANGYAARWQILKEGIKGKVLDGILVRASMAVDDAQSAEIAYQNQERFLLELTSKIDPKYLNILVAK